MFLGKLLGLMTTMSTSTILHILQFTNMTSEPLTAYKRYLVTIFHMCVWYNHDFKFGSELWRSIATVKALHNSASQRSCAAGFGRISQKDMGITQFGFMGYAVVRPELIGIHWATKEELEGLIHFWRVIGYIIGIENRFNICRDSVEETKQICEALIGEVFIPNVGKKNPEYLRMTDALLKGMWVMQPFLETGVFLSYMYRLLNYNLSSNGKLPEPRIKSMWKRFLLSALEIYIGCLRFYMVRLFSNTLQYLTFWLMKNFPFLAYHKYGYENSYVTIYVKKENIR